jgi:peptidoglycan/LPS O-acetylase OafA/YrhL
LILAPLLLRVGFFGPWRDLLMGATFCGLIAFCFALQDRGWTLGPLARLQPLGEMSYTLYIIHFPILVLMSGCLLKASGGSLPEHFGWVALAIVLCAGLAWPLHLITERPFLPRPPKPSSFTATALR